MRNEGSLSRTAVAAVLVVCLAGCGSPAAGPPPIKPGSACAACGMKVTDLRFATERQAGKQWKVYDSIECLLDDVKGVRPADAYLADYDTRTLYPADSLWIVHGSFPSPMGGGYAAFRAREAADGIASQTGGRVGRLSDFTRPAAAKP